MLFFFFFFFKQKTAYEMRISDWSSDVCSSDLHVGAQDLRPVAGHARRRGGEADLVEVEQAEARLFRREAAAVEEVAGGDAGVEMVGADVGIVEADQFGGRTAPEEAMGEAEHHGVVDSQSGRRVDPLTGQPTG